MPFGLHLLIMQILNIIVPSVSNDADGRVRQGRECRKFTLFINILRDTASPAVFLQIGESTPTITGYFEVTVAGELVHSKKVWVLKCSETCDPHANYHRMVMALLILRLS